MVCALFFVVQRRAGQQAQAASAATEHSALFRNVIDLTSPGSSPVSSPVAGSQKTLQLSTRLVAPAQFVRGAWGVDDIPPQRLLGTLVVLDVRAQAAGHAAVQISADEIDHWERIHGEIPPDGIVIALTGRTVPDREGNFPVFSNDAIEFLATGRNVLALGTDAPAVTRTSAASEALARRGIYQLSGVAGLDMAPESGAVLVVAPGRTGGASQGDARLLALLR